MLNHVLCICVCLNEQITGLGFCCIFRKRFWRCSLWAGMHAQTQNAISFSRQWTALFFWCPSRKWGSSSQLQKRTFQTFIPLSLQHSLSSTNCEVRWLCMLEEFHLLLGLVQLLAKLLSNVNKGDFDHFTLQHWQPQTCSHGAHSHPLSLRLCKHQSAFLAHFYFLIAAVC